MAPSSAEWQRLSPLKPDDIEDIASDDSKRLDDLATDFNRLKVRDFDDINDLKLALQFGQRFAKIFRSQRDDTDQEVIRFARENDELRGAATQSAKEANPAIRQELERMEQEIDEYRMKYQEARGKLEAEADQRRNDADHMKSLQNKIDSLERSNDAYLQQLKDLQTTRKAAGDSAQGTSRVRTLERQLNQIYDENNQHAAEKLSLQKLTNELRQQLAEATKQINESANEFKNMMNRMRVKDEEILSLRNEVNMLNDQLSKFNKDDDDAIFQAVQERVKKVTDLFQEKDEEIDRLKEQIVFLKEKIQRAALEPSDGDPSGLQQKLRQKEEEIKMYRRKLEDATKVINEHTDNLNNLAQTARGPSDPTSISARSNAYELNRLKKQVDDYEKETERLQEKIRDLHEQIDRFTSGRFDIEDAVNEIRQLKEQIHKKEKTINEIATYASKAELEVHEVSEENEELRAKLGMDPRKPMTKEELEEAKTSRTYGNQAVIQVLQKEIEDLQERLFKSTRLCREMARQAGTKAGQEGFGGIEIDIDEFDSSVHVNPLKKPGKNKYAEDYDEQVKARDLKLDQIRRELQEKEDQNRNLIMEIQGLEQGLREINEQLKQKRTGRSSSGEVQTIQCPSLDRLLQVLETQSAFGRYNGSIIVKSESDKMAGRLDELRDELYRCRHEKTRIEVDLKVLDKENEKLRRDLKLFEEAGAVPLNYQQMKIPQGVSPSSRDIITALNEYLIDALAEVSAQREMNQQLEEGIEKYRRKLNVIKHQTGLLYKDFHEKQQQWLSERDGNNQAKHDLQTEIEKNLVKLQEFDRLLNTLEQDDAEVRRRVAEVTRKITVLRVNEKALARKIISYQDIESRLRKDNTKLRGEVIDMEVTVQTRLNYLQRFKDTAAYRIKNLQNQVEQSVHQSELDKINRRYEEISEKYRDLLEQQNDFVQQTERSSVVSEENRKLTNEVEFLRRQLEIDKEKLHVLEETFENLKNQGLIDAGYSRSSEHSTPHYLPSVDESAASLARRITVLEMKELNERQRAEYSQKLYDQQRTTLRQMEDRNLELETKFRDLTRMNLEMQRTERQLREELVYSVPRTVSDADKRRIGELEALEIQSKQEISRLREVADVASYQVTAINDIKVLDEKEFQSMRLQLIDLQSKSDDKTEIGKLHRHILALQISEATAKRKILLLESDLAKQRTVSLRTEQKLDEKEQSLFFIRQEYTQRIRFLRTALQDYRNKYAGALPLNVQENYAKTMIEIRNGKKNLDEQLKNVQNQKHELETQIEAYDFKYKSLEELTSTLKSNSTNSQVQKIIEWQNKLEKAKLNELRHIKLNQRLQAENEHLQGVIKTLEISVTQQEESIIKFEREIEERQLLWEHRELALEKKIEQLEKEQGAIADAAKRFEEATGHYPDPSLPVAHQLEQALGIIRDNIQLLMEAKIQSKLIEKKTADHLEKVHELENAVLARDKVIQELRIRIPMTTALDTDKIVSDAMTKPDDYSRFAVVRAAQATIDSLKAIIIEKERNVEKYQQLLEAARNDLTARTQQYDEEIRILNEQLNNKRDMDLLRLKEFAGRGSTHFQGSFEGAELTKIRTLEENLAVQENTIAHLNEKLREARREAETWKGRLQKKDEDHKRDQANLKASIERLGNLEKQIEEIQMKEKSLAAQLNAKSKDTPRTPKDSNENAELQRQLVEGEERRKHLIKTLADIRREMVEISDGNIRALKDTEKQNQSVQALINAETAKLLARIDELDEQNLQLKRELKKQRTLVQQHAADATDAREKSAQKDNKIKSLQGQLDQATAAAQRRITGQQGQGQAGETIEDLRRQIRSLEEKLRKTKTAERPMEDFRDDRSQRTVDALKQQVNDLDTHKKELLKFNQQLKDELSKIRLRNEELQKLNAFLKSENENLRNGDSSRSSSSGSIRRIGDSGKSNVELEKIIAVMKKRIDQLQSENQNFRSDLDRQRLTIDSNRAFFTQATESTRDIDQLSQINARLQKEVSLLRERIAQLQTQSNLPFPRSSNDNQGHS